MRVRSLTAVVLLLLVAGGSSAQDKAFDSGGVKIRYTDQGKGDPVVLIHGFAINPQLQWDLPGITKELARDYRVLVLDNRGHGRSGKPHDPKKYGKEMVADVVRLLNHLKIERAHVVGYSMGAFITLNLMTTHPDRLLTATLGGAGRGREKETGVLEEIAASLEKGKGFGPLMQQLSPLGKPKPTDKDVQAVNQFLGAINDPKALAAVLRGMHELTVTDEALKRNKVPTLAVIGDLDPLKRQVDDLKGDLANLQVVVIEGADHLNAHARPEFLASLREFLAKHGRRPSAAAER
jgi:pimeloyl-ACP methyl ester carboxylesterase